jgi:hypothetical protein
MSRQARDRQTKGKVGRNEKKRGVFSLSAAGTIPCVRENGSFEPFMHKCDILPRHARDKHREKLKNRVAFSQVGTRH